jgi:hypothetical protein
MILAITSVRSIFGCRRCQSDDDGIIIVRLKNYHVAECSVSWALNVQEEAMGFQKSGHGMRHAACGM